jgi:hypothetical protein
MFQWSQCCCFTSHSHTRTHVAYLSSLQQKDNDMMIFRRPSTTRQVSVIINWDKNRKGGIPHLQSMNAHRGSGSIAPPIFNLSNRLRRVVKFLPTFYTSPLEIFENQDACAEYFWTVILQSEQDKRISPWKYGNDDNDNDNENDFPTKMFCSLVFFKSSRFILRPNHHLWFQTNNRS